MRRFMRYLKLDRNYSVNTQEAYSHDLGYFKRFLHERKLSPLDVKLEDLEQFAASLHEYNIGARTQSRILFGVRSFYRYLTLDGYLEVDPTELLESPILPKHLPTYLTTEEVDQLEDSIDLETNEGQRNRAIIETLFSCGLRVSELTNLKLSDLNLDEHFIRVIGKGDKERLVPISDRAIHELQLWFEERKKMKKIEKEEQLKKKLEQTMEEKMAADSKTVEGESAVVKAEEGNTATEQEPEAAPALSEEELNAMYERFQQRLQKEGLADAEGNPTEKTLEIRRQIVERKAEREKQAERQKKIAKRAKTTKHWVRTAKAAGVVLVVGACVFGASMTSEANRIRLVETINGVRNTGDVAKMNNGEDREYSAGRFKPCGRSDGI